MLIPAVPPVPPQNAPLPPSLSLPDHPLSRPRSPPPKRRSASLPPMKPLPPTPRPTFHLAVDASDPEEDTRPNNTDSSGPATTPLQDPLLYITQREALRRYHALSELLSTELGYLFDLRTLVSVNIPLSVLLPRVSSFLPGLSSSASHFEKPFVLATTPWFSLFVKPHYRSLFAPPL